MNTSVSMGLMELRCAGGLVSGIVDTLGGATATGVHVQALGGARKYVIQENIRIWQAFFYQQTKLPSNLVCCKIY